MDVNTLKELRTADACIGRLDVDVAVDEQKLTQIFICKVYITTMKSPPYVAV